MTRHKLLGRCCTTSNVSQESAPWPRAPASSAVMCRRQIRVSTLPTPAPGGMRISRSHQGWRSYQHRGLAAILHHCPRHKSCRGIPLGEHRTVTPSVKMPTGPPFLAALTRTRNPACGSYPNACISTYILMDLSVRSTSLGKNRHFGKWAQTTPCSGHNTGVNG